MEILIIQNKIWNRYNNKQNNNQMMKIKKIKINLKLKIYNRKEVYLQINK